MANSGATFNRMMRELLTGCLHTDSYVDDILGHTITRDIHIKMLQELFTRIRDAGLTVKPSKCFIGFSNIGFTGHVVGKGLVQMEEDKITKIKEAISQTTILRLPDFSRPFNTAV